MLQRTPNGNYPHYQRRQYVMLPQIRISPTIHVHKETKRRPKVHFKSLAMPKPILEAVLDNMVAPEYRFFPRVHFPVVNPKIKS
jgi:hypothetical protein